LLRLLADRDLLIEEQKKYKLYKGTMPKVDRDMAKAEMGAWLADYFDDAGYDNWESQCQLYKAMVMSAFPPIDPLDAVKPDFGSMPITQFEDNVSKFVNTLDDHLATEERRVTSHTSVRGLTALIKGR